MSRMTTATQSSTPRLSEVARHLVYPEGIVTSGWPRIKKRLSDMAIDYDTWQAGAAQLILGHNKDGRYCATVGGVTMSLPRQVGKTFTVGSLLVAMCLEYPGLRVVWTSHHLRTTTNTFRSMQGMVRRKKVAAHLAHNGIRTANGEQEIRFTNGSIIMFGARERGFGVGIDAIDVLVCDEAQRLSSRSLADMVPTTNQARHKHGALVFFIGTPPRPTDEGDEFIARRSKALAGKMKNGIYVELSADGDADLNDPDQWSKANPSYPHRTPHESMLRMRENLTDDSDWRREAMGIWDELVKNYAFGPGGWEACALDADPGSALGAVGLSVSMDRTHSSIGAAGDIKVCGEERILVGAVDRREGTGWLVPEAWRIHTKHNVPVVVGRAASDLIPALEAVGFVVGTSLIIARANDAMDACAGIFDRVQQGILAHANHPELDESVYGAHRRSSGGGERWAWDRKNSTADVSMLEAVTLAAWGITAKQQTPMTPMAAFI